MTDTLQLPGPLALIRPWDAEEYHSDPCDSPSLSSSIAHTIVAKSPLHAWAEHPKLGAKDEPEEEGTKATNAGAVIHNLLLGKGQKYTVIQADDFRTKAAQSARDIAVLAGQVPVLVEQFERLTIAAARIRDRCSAYGVLLDGQSEVAVEWLEDSEEEFGQVRCRSMFDHWKPAEHLLIDVKTCRSANPKDIARHFVEYGYDIQQAAYTRAAERLDAALLGRIKMLFLFCEIEPPYSVVPARPDGALREIGRHRWARAVHTWQNCLSSGVWEDYADNGPVTLEAPQWDIARELGNYEGSFR